MEIKVGYFRTNLGLINQIIGVNKELDNIVIKGKDVIYSFGAYENIFGDYNITDRPQELIQVGDLICHNEWEDYDELELVRGVLKTKDILLSGSVPVFPENITKIYTPNKDKSQYTLQWESE